MPVVTCEIKLLQNYFSLRRRPCEIILFRHVETCLKLFHRLIAAQEYFPTCSWLQIILETILAAEVIFISISDVVTCEIKQ